MEVDPWDTLSWPESFRAFLDANHIDPAIYQVQPSRYY